MFAQQLVNGLSIGCMYSLVSMGYSMVYGILRIVNFAHGEIFMMGTFVALLLYQTGIGPLPAFVCAVLLTSCLGILLERIAYRPIRSADASSVLISSVGASTFLLNLAQVLFGPETQPFRYPVSTLAIGTVALTDVQICMAVLTALLIFILFFVIQKTKIGTAMRATSHSVKNAKLMGINTNFIIAFTFAIGSALACIAGILIGIFFDAVWPGMGFIYGIKAFAAAILGGIGNLPGALVGGLFIGTIETLGTAYISSGWRNGYAFGILILVLIFKPSGIFGKTNREKV